MDCDNPKVYLILWCFFSSGMQKRANTKIIVTRGEGELGNGVGDGGTESWLAPLSPSSL